MTIFAEIPLILMVLKINELKIIWRENKKRLDYKQLIVIMNATGHGKLFTRFLRQRVLLR